MKKSNHASWARAFGDRASTDAMYRSILVQFFEGSDWDSQARVWEQFRKKRLRRPIRAGLQRLLTLQEKFHDAVFERCDDHAEYCTSEAIKYELFSCYFLLLWDIGEAAPEEVQRRLRACTFFYTWAMKPAGERPSRTPVSRAAHREFVRVSRLLRPSYAKVGRKKRERVVFGRGSST